MKLKSEKKTTISEFWPPFLLIRWVVFRYFDKNLCTELNKSSPFLAIGILQNALFLLVLTCPFFFFSIMTLKKLLVTFTCSAAKTICLVREVQYSLKFPLPYVGQERPLNSYWSYYDKNIPLLQTATLSQRREDSIHRNIYSFVSICFIRC